MNIDEEFYSDISLYYNYDKLVYLYNNYFWKIEGYINNQTHLYREIIDPRTNKKEKTYLVKIISAIYTDKNLFNKFFSSLDHQTQEIFTLIVNSGVEVNINEIINKTGKNSNIDSSGKLNQSKNNILYNLFSYTSNYGKYYLSLPESIKEVLRNYLTIYNEDNGELNKTSIPKNIIVYENKAEILNELYNFISYLENIDKKTNINIEFNSNDRIKKSSLVKISKTLKISEFYKDTKDLEYLRTELIFNFLTRIKFKKSKEYNSLDILKSCINNYLDPKTLFYSYTMLFHVIFSKSFLKNKKDYVKNNHFHESIIKVLKKLPVNEGVSIENIIDYISINNLFIKLILEFTAKEFYYIPNGNSYKEEIRNSNLYKNVIIKSAIKASMFLFSSLGLIDIAYYFPKNQETGNDDYISPFDGLRYVRLNDLGANILGLSNNTTKFEHYKKNETKIILDSNKLIISLSQVDTLKASLVRKFAKQISDTKFNITSYSFLFDCNSKEDINKKIKLFKEKISSNIPKNFDDFFKELLNKSNNFEKQSDFVIYRVSKNKELIDLIYKDDDLIDKIIKMEDFQIAIKSENMKKVKERFKEFGYIL